MHRLIKHAIDNAKAVEVEDRGSVNYAIFNTFRVDEHFGSVRVSGLIADDIFYSNHEITRETGSLGETIPLQEFIDYNNSHPAPTAELPTENQIRSVAKKYMDPRDVVVHENRVGHISDGVTIELEEEQEELEEYRHYCSMTSRNGLNIVSVIINDSSYVCLNGAAVMERLNQFFREYIEEQKAIEEISRLAAEPIEPDDELLSILEELAK